MPMAIAHRGDPIRERENTLGAVEAAAAAGAGMVEIDVRLTADGVLVVLHDATLDRLWGLPMRVSVHTWAELAAVLPVLEPTVPQLEAVLLTAGRLGIDLMVDLPDARVAGACCANAAVREALGRVVFCGDPDALALVRSELPPAVISLSWQDPVLPDAALLRRVAPRYLNQLADLVDAAMVTSCHADGLLVSTYTVDSPDEMRRVIACGVDAVISNDIRTLVDVLA